DRCSLLSITGAQKIDWGRVWRYSAGAYHYLSGIRVSRVASLWRFSGDYGHSASSWVGGWRCVAAHLATDSRFHSKCAFAISDLSLSGINSCGNLYFFQRAALV